MLISTIVSVFFVLLFLFLFWRNLKEDYVATQIFTSAFYVLVIVLVFSAISYVFVPTAWFWSGFFGCAFGIIIGVRRQRIRLTEIFEAFTFAVLPIFIGLNIFDYFKNASVFKLLIIVYLVSLYFVLLFFKKHYKKFSWYKSGKVGFASSATLLLFFTSRSILAIFFDDVLSFWTGKELYLSLIWAVFFLASLFKLSKKS